MWDRDLDMQLALQIRSIRMPEAVCREILGEIYQGQHTDLYAPVFRLLSTDEHLTGLQPEDPGYSTREQSA
jgi:hypothetical protein